MPPHTPLPKKAQSSFGKAATPAGLYRCIFYTDPGGKKCSNLWNGEENRLYPRPFDLNPADFKQIMRGGKLTQFHDNHDIVVNFLAAYEPPGAQIDPCRKARSWFSVGVPGKRMPQFGEKEPQHDDFGDTKMLKCAVYIDPRTLQHLRLSKTIMLRFSGTPKPRPCLPARIDHPNS